MKPNVSKSRYSFNGITESLACLRLGSCLPPILLAVAGDNPRAQIRSPGDNSSSGRSESLVRATGPAPWAPLLLAPPPRPARWPQVLPGLSPAAASLQKASLPSADEANTDWASRPR